MTESPAELEQSAPLSPIRTIIEVLGVDDSVLKVRRSLLSELDGIRRNPNLLTPETRERLEFLGETLLMLVRDSAILLNELEATGAIRLERAENGSFIPQIGRSATEPATVIELLPEPTDLVDSDSSQGADEDEDTQPKPEIKKSLALPFQVRIDGVEHQLVLKGRNQAFILEMLAAIGPDRPFARAQAFKNDFYKEGRLGARGKGFGLAFGAVRQNIEHVTGSDIINRSGEKRKTQYTLTRQLEIAERPTDPDYEYRTDWVWDKPKPEKVKKTKKRRQRKPAARRQPAAERKTTAKFLFEIEINGQPYTLPLKNPRQAFIVEMLAALGPQKEFNSATALQNNFHPYGKPESRRYIFNNDFSCMRKLFETTVGEPVIFKKGDRRSTRYHLPQAVSIIERPESADYELPEQWNFSLPQRIEAAPKALEPEFGLYFGNDEDQDRSPAYIASDGPVNSGFFGKIDLEKIDDETSRLRSQAAPASAAVIGIPPDSRIRPSYSIKNRVISAHFGLDGESPRTIDQIVMDREINPSGTLSPLSVKAMIRDVLKISAEPAAKLYLAKLDEE